MPRIVWSINDPALAMPHFDHQILDMLQSAVKKVIRARDHHDRQLLRPGPVEHRAQRDGVVQFAVNQDGVGSDFRHRPFACGGANQCQAFGWRLRRVGLCRLPLLQLSLDKGPKREARQCEWQVGILTAHVCQ